MTPSRAPTAGTWDLIRINKTLHFVGNLHRQGEYVVNTHKQIWAAIGLVAALSVGATLTCTARAEEYHTFHVVGHLKLPATKVPNDFHHLHVSETDSQRFVTVSDSNNIMTIVDVTDRTHPTLTRQVVLPTVVAHGDPVILMGGVALVTEAASKPATPEVRTVSIVSMKGQTESDVTGRFENVTGIEVDATQTHIYLISGNDLWILGGREEWGAFFRK
jgi:hypothetical protein